MEKARELTIELLEASLEKQMDWTTGNKKSSEDDIDFQDASTIVEDCLEILEKE